jgi:hypothetical protein
MTTGNSMPRVSLKTIGENWAAAPEKKAALLTTEFRLALQVRQQVEQHCAEKAFRFSLTHAGPEF